MRLSQSTFLTALGISISWSCPRQFFIVLIRGVGCANSLAAIRRTVRALSACLRCAVDKFTGVVIGVRFPCGGKLSNWPDISDALRARPPPLIAWRLPAKRKRHANATTTSNLENPFLAFIIIYLARPYINPFHSATCPQCQQNPGNQHTGPC